MVSKILLIQLYIYMILILVMQSVLLDYYYTGWGKKLSVIFSKYRGLVRYATAQVQGGP